MLPFDVDIRPGASVHQQVVHAVEHALVEGRLAPGDRFPSVRALSKELRINPNTAHKIVSTLVDAGVLEVRPGIGTLISQQPQTADPRQIELLLGPRLERT
ncbi:MAG: GntR family transcriptional regulator, partial [Myxococcota bacterium]